MPPDATFRLALVIGFTAIVPIMLYHRVRSWASHEKLDRRKEGLFILATLRPAGLLFFLGTFAYMIDPARMAWSSVPLADWLRWSGVGLFALAGALLLWTLHNLGTNLTDTVVTRQAHTLVTRGPYRWVRHPFYDVMGLLILAVSLVTANWFLFVTGALVLLLLVLRTRTEEAELLARFGDSYQKYLERTGRFLPKLINH